MAAAGGNNQVGLALGSGSARGWAHIGVIRALMELGIEPDIVCGTSIGALVGAFYVTGNLDSLEEWTRGLHKHDVLQFIDIKLLPRGGLLEGDRIVQFLQDSIGDREIADLPKPFAAVATDLLTGQEIWLTTGSLVEAVRASVSVPCIFTPVTYGEHLLVDGGLVDPVPVSACKALGADVILAVNLNSEVLGKHICQAKRSKTRAKASNSEPKFLHALSAGLKKWTSSLGASISDSLVDTLSFFDVMNGSLSIMQNYIVRSRLADDQPDVTINPRVVDIGFLDFDKAAEAIAEGKRAVERIGSELHDLIRTR
ncbi:MAG: patatin-like phospholipase family protein [Deltaproteobacteria bacterium]|nr:patatin-like phospholipase family protein [Deltaproteobacteria bacterium]MBW2072163.1 patatin-like phospholipase family protein [Deltaproteobacteria bacterium]